MYISNLLTTIIYKYRQMNGCRLKIADLSILNKNWEKPKAEGDILMEAIKVLY